MIKKRLIALIFSFFFIFSIFIPFIPISPLINNISQEGVTQDKNEPIEKIIDTDLDLATKNSSIISQGSAIGTGNPQTVTLTCEKNQTLTNYNSTNDFNITTSGWNMTQAYLNFTEIFAPNYTYTIEDYSNNTVSLSSEYAGSFKIDQDTTLTQISVYFSCSAIQPRFYYSIYNATWDGFKPKPHVAIFSSIGLTTQSIAASWKKYNSSVDLMTDETDNNTYFVSAYTSVIQIYWSFQRDLDDGSDDSYAYIHDFSPDWTLYQDPVSPFSLIDFNFKVDLTNYTVKPSQVNMQVNGTNVSDIDFGEGTVLLNQTEISQGNFDQIRFDIQSDSFINYSVNCSGNFQNQTSINSVYEVLTAENTDWNVSFTADFLANANNQKINSTIGSDWENATIYNNSVIYDNVIIDESDDLVFIDNVTTNGSWVLSCSQENYGNTIQLYQYGSLNNITLNRLVNMSDTIYINATLSGATGGEANLTIFDPIGTNVVNKSNNDTISGTLITFTDVILPNIATTNGTYIIQILWWNGSAVSLMQTDLEIINRTQLNLLSEAQITGQHYIGDYINISVYLNDTSKGSGSPCGDADLSIEVFNLTDESIVETISSGSISEGILGSGYYNYTLNTINYINGSFKIRVNSTKLGAVNHTLNTSSFSLIFDTNLTLVNFAGTNLGTTYYNNSIFLKFAYDFNNSRYSYNQNVSIGVAFDDATYDNGGTWLPSFNDITTSDPMIGEITRAYMRFQINLSRGATVTKANLYLNITSTTDPDIRIVLIDDECLSFPFGSGDETSYPESSFYVDFNASQSVGWNVVDISSLIQAFVNRDDYHPGQYMGLKFKETFITPDSGDQITIAAFESGTEYCSYIDLEANGGEDIVQDPSIITIQIDEESPVILHLNDTTKTYDIQLNSTDHPFITHTLQVVAQKMGYKNYSKPYTWTTIGANGRIENFLVDQQTVINNTGIVNTNFPNNITVSFQYLNDTSIDGAIANVSINGSYLKAINYYPSTETYNFTVNFEEIGYNPTYPEVLPKEISVEISKYGYDPLFYNFTWNYSRAETDLTYNGTIAALYTYPTNLTLTLNYSVSSLYSNEEVENGNVKVYVNETDHIVTWDPISELYNVTFNNTNFYNRTEIWNITITASRNGFENRSLQFWWNTSEILTDLTLDNIAGTDLGTTYYNKSIYLKFSYNMTSPNIWVQNPEVITIQVDGNIPINLNTNGSFNCYDISLDSMDYPFGLHTIQVIAQKYGYQNRTQNYTWKTENATARIENFLVNGLSVTNETGIVNTNYPNNLTISFVYSNDTAIHGATANISVNGIYLKDISYYGASQTYNFTLDFTEINYNPTYPDNIAPIIMVNISKYGYTAAWYYFTWNYSRAETDLTYNGTIAALYTYPTNLTLTLNYSVSSLYSNEEVENALMTCLVNNSYYKTINYDPASGLYNITLDINDFPFINGTAYRNVTINTSRNGFENQTIQFWWNVTEILASFSLDSPSIVGTDLGITYWNNSIFLKFSYNTTAPNQYIQNPDVAKLWLGSNEYNLTYNMTSDSYDILLNTTQDYGFNTHDIMVNFSKYGYNNYSQNYTWTVQIAQTSFDIFDILGTSYVGLNHSVISTFYPNNISIGLRYVNDTFIDGATVTAQVEGLGTHNFIYDSNTGTYNLTLNYTNLGYGDNKNIKLDITISAIKYGYYPVTYNFTWNFTEAQTYFNITSPIDLLDEDELVRITTPYGSNLTIMVNYSVYDPLIANISQANVTVKVGTTPIGYSSANGPYYLWFNVTSGLWQIQLNTTDFNLGLKYLFFEANRTGYKDFLYSATHLLGYWDINESGDVTIIPTFNATSLGGDNYCHWYQQLPLNLTFLYSQTKGGGGITGATRSITIRENGTTPILFYYDNANTTELGEGYYQVMLNDPLIADKWYRIEILADYTTTAPVIKNIYLFVNETQTTLISNNTILNHLIWGDTLVFNVTYNDTTWNQLLTGATISNNWTVGGVDWTDNYDGNYTITVPLNDTNLASITHAGIWTIRIQTILENRTTGICTVNFNITGRTNYTLFNNTFEDNVIIGNDITDNKNITTYFNESAILFIHYNSTDFSIVSLTEVSISHNWTWGIYVTPIGTNGTFAIRFHRGASTGIHGVRITVKQDQYISQIINVKIIILEKHLTNVTLISAIPESLPAGSTFRIMIRLFDQTANEPIGAGTIIFTIAGEQYIRIVNATGFANVTFTVPIVAFSIEITYLGGFGTNTTAIVPLSVQVTTGFDIWFIIIIVIIVMAVSIGSTVTAVIVRQRRKRSVEKTKARKAKVIASVTDVANIKHVTVIHKGMGIDIFSYAIEKGIDPTLLSGFLQAVREFGREFSREKEEETKEDEI